MPLLAYCVMDAGMEAETPGAGVGGATLEELREGGLRCVYSRFASQEALSSIPAVKSALAFHEVLQFLLRQAAVVPFRFPTVVEDEQQLANYLKEHRAQYGEALSRFRQLVQMEIHIPGEKRVERQAASGGEYLRERQAQAGSLAAAAASFREQTKEWVAEWREQPTGQGMRCYALIDRDAVEGFRQAALGLSARFAGARVSGPWPPTAFLQGIKGF